MVGVAVKFGHEGLGDTVIRTIYHSSDIQEVAFWVVSVFAGFIPFRISGDHA
jgi:hypothetical protein